MRYFYSVAIALFFSSTVNAIQDDFVEERTIRDIALGGITIGTNSIISIAGNSDTSTQFQIAYRNKFAMKEMSVGSLVGVFSSSFMTNAVSLFSAGYDNYRETLFSLHGQKSLFEFFNLGVSLHHSSVSAVTLEKNIWCLYPKIGVEYAMRNAWRLGVTIDNPVRIYSDKDYPLDKEFRIEAGVSYRLAEVLMIAGEYNYTDGASDCFRLGGEFAFIPTFKVRIGVVSRPFSPCFGCGYILRQWTLDLSSEQHRYLGNSLSLGLSYHFKR